MIDLSLQRHALLALTAAALFGVSPPLAKLLVGQVSPVVLAGLLYLGSGFGLLAVWLGKRLRSVPGDSASAKVGIQRGDYPWLAGAILSGGVLAPVLLMWGLSGTTAANASLLLSAEGVTTVLIAAFLFREAVGGRVWIASFVMLVGGLLLAYDPSAPLGLSLNAIAVLGACVMWGLDNNLTRNISANDPVVIAMIKGLSAGVANLALGLAVGGSLPTAGIVAAALVLGALSYGASLVFYILALRHLGSARTAAHFGTAPFIGAGLSVVLLGEPLTIMLVAAVIVMALATWLVLTERHRHEHTHDVLEHCHQHIHDTHHQHEHHGDEGQEPHTHSHRHEPMAHSHPHLPDIHHRHEH